MEQYEQLIRSTVSRYYKVTEDREDATQEVLYTLLKNGNRYELNEALVRTFAKNHCINAKRKRRLNYQSFANLHWESFGQFSCLNEAIGGFEQHRLNLLLSLLTKQQRAVMDLVIQGYDYYEIADKLGKSYNAVKLSVATARKRMKDNIWNLQIVSRSL